MIYSYNLSKLNLTLANRKQQKQTSKSSLLLKNKVLDILETLEITQNQNLSNRIIERLMVLNDNDIQLIHSICNKLKEKIT